MARAMPHDIIDNCEAHFADGVRPLLSQSVLSHFAVGLTAELLIIPAEALR